MYKSILILSFIIIYLFHIDKAHADLEMVDFVGDELYGTYGDDFERSKLLNQENLKYFQDLMYRRYKVLLESADVEESIVEQNLKMQSRETDRLKSMVDKTQKQVSSVAAKIDFMQDEKIKAEERFREMIDGLASFDVEKDTSDRLERKLRRARTTIANWKAALAKQMLIKEGLLEKMHNLSMRYKDSKKEYNHYFQMKEKIIAKREDIENNYNEDLKSFMALTFKRKEEIDSLRKYFKDIVSLKSRGPQRNKEEIAQRKIVLQFKFKNFFKILEDEQKKLLEEIKNFELEMSQKELIYDWSLESDECYGQDTQKGFYYKFKAQTCIEKVGVIYRFERESRNCQKLTTKGIKLADNENKLECIKVRGFYHMWKRDPQTGKVACYRFPLNMSEQRDEIIYEGDESGEKILDDIFCRLEHPVKNYFWNSRLSICQEVVSNEADYINDLTYFTPSYDLEMHLDRPVDSSRCLDLQELGFDCLSSFQCSDNSFLSSLSYNLAAAVQTMKDREIPEERLKPLVRYIQDRVLSSFGDFLVSDSSEGTDREQLLIASKLENNLFEDISTLILHPEKKDRVSRKDQHLLEDILGVTRIAYQAQDTTNAYQYLLSFFERPYKSIKGPFLRNMAKEEMQKVVRKIVDLDEYIKSKLSAQEWDVFLRYFSKFRSIGYKGRVEISAEDRQMCIDAAYKIFPHLKGKLSDYQLQSYLKYIQLIEFFGKKQKLPDIKSVLNEAGHQKIRGNIQAEIDTLIDQYHQNSQTILMSDNIWKKIKYYLKQFRDQSSVNRKVFGTVFNKYVQGQSKMRAIVSLKKLFLAYNDLATEQEVRDLQGDFLRMIRIISEDTRIERVEYLSDGVHLYEVRNGIKHHVVPQIPH